MTWLNSNVHNINEKNTFDLLRLIGKIPAGWYGRIGGDRNGIAAAEGGRKPSTPTAATVSRRYMCPVKDASDGQITS